MFYQFIHKPAILYKVPQNYSQVGKSFPRVREFIFGPTYRGDTFDGLPISVRFPSPSGGGISRSFFAGRCSFVSSM
jgi:hypothetical protein